MTVDCSLHATRSHIGMDMLAENNKEYMHDVCDRTNESYDVEVMKSSFGWKRFLEHYNVTNGPLSSIPATK